MAAIGAFLSVRRRKRGVHGHGSKEAEEARVSHAEMTTKPLFSDGAAAHLNVTSVLEKRYQVAHDYSPTADDEIVLRVGDIVRLSLLFNDGWAKVYALYVSCCI